MVMNKTSNSMKTFDSKLLCLGFYNFCELQDLFVKCVYRLRTWFNTEAETSILELKIARDISIEIPATGRQLYR